ncbi:MAG TPA: DUF4184 family protein [Marmoricola sp.]|nr:DUF4184 family protein [Marmoricola sp.]
MPLTVAHPAAVLPLRRLGLPMSAMVIGSMVPDVPLFVRWPGGYQVSHSYTGVFTVDLLGALVVLLGWNAFARDALVDLAPSPVRDRLASRHRLSLRQWLLAPAAAALGSITHVFWDAFTHQHRWGVASFAWLRADVGPLPGYRWAQYLSGVVGLAIVLGSCIALLRRRPPNRTARPRTLPPAVLPVVVGAAMVHGGLAALSRAQRGLHAVAFHGAVQGILALAAGTAVICLLWLLEHLRRSHST